MKRLVRLGYEVRVNQGVMVLVDDLDMQPKAEYDVVQKTLKSEHLDLHTLEVFIQVINKYESGK